MAGLALDGVVIDNSGELTPVELPAGLRLLAPGRNLGYAGGVNRGLEATDAELAVVLNPDVRVLPGCLAALLEALAAGAAAAGPLFCWDDAGAYLLPPTERRDRLSELLAALARRGEGWARLARRRWRRHARRAWEATAPVVSSELSGALLALRRSAWSAVGPFNEGFALYFEETEWLLRLRDAGLVSRLVPAARAVHLHARSTLQEPRAEDWFAASSRRFRRLRFGDRFARLLEALGPARPRLSPARPRLPRDASGAPLVPLEAPWLELSPDPRGFPAAARRGAAAGEPLFPAELGERLPPGAWTIRAVDARGRELAAWELGLTPADGLR